MDLLIRTLLLAAGSLFLAWKVHAAYKLDCREEQTQEKERRELLSISGILLPLYIGILVWSEMSMGRTVIAAVLGVCFDIFLHIGMYYVILMPMMPFFRRRISARACALLWMLPNYLYIMKWSVMSLSEPLITIHTSTRMVTGVFTVWLMGFGIVLAWNIAGHLLFRRQMLRCAVPVTDAQTLECLQEETAKWIQGKPRFKLVTSPCVHTPLSIGLFSRRVRIVLPQKNYAQEELQLIFRHELIHIERGDSWTKFFMMFCTAMCWFHPLMWIAMRKSAADVEMSCDETVLLEADDTQRQRYARLILSTAGDDRGFSTCLSASASSVRYRLKAIVQPDRRSTGALLVGAVFCVLCMSFGYVSLAYGENTGANTVFRNREWTEFEAYYIEVDGGYYADSLHTIDEEKLTQYIAGLQTQEALGNYSYVLNDKSLLIRYNSPDDDILEVRLSANFISVQYPGEEMGVRVYHVPGGIDWSYIDQIVPSMPIAEVKIWNEDGDRKTLTAWAVRMTRTADGESRVMLDRDRGVELYSGRKYSDAMITFSQMPSSPAEIWVEPIGHGNAYTIYQMEANDEFAFALPSCAADYTVYVSFEDESGAIYDIEYRFRLESVG